MGIWKDKSRKEWCYSFEFEKKCHAARGFKTRKDAEAARSIRKQGLRLKAKSAKNNKDIDLHNVEGYFEFLKAKYKALLDSPQNTLPDLIDAFFKDFDLPYSYPDVRKIVLDSKRAKVPVQLRADILKRDGYVCILCGNGPPEHPLQIDHIVPVSRGGLTEKRNLRTLCRSCNLGKTDLPFFISG